MGEPKTGRTLQEAITNLPPHRPALIEELLYEKTVTMLAAEPGAGKSTVITQLILALSGADSVFSRFRIPAHKNSYYLQLEGGEEESFRRIGLMSRNLHHNFDCICWDSPTLFDALDASIANETIQRLQRWDRPIDLLVMDPIYMAVAGDLVKADVSNGLIRFIEKVRRTFNCSVILIHHTHRARYASNGSKINEEDPYYGSQWLKAYVDVGYCLRSLPDGTGVEIDSKKSRAGEVVKKLTLLYDPETFTCNVADPRPILAVEDILLDHLTKMSERNEVTDFRKAMQDTQLSPASMRRAQKALTDRGLLVISNGHGNSSRTWTLVRQGTSAAPGVQPPDNTQQSEQT